MRIWFFMVFNVKNLFNDFVCYLGRVLLCLVIGMFVIYCFKDIYILKFFYGINEIIVFLFVIFLYCIFKVFVLSIMFFIIFYMVLV